MAKYLVSTTETYRVDTEKEALAAIEEAKQDNSCVLSKYTNEHKEVKAKGEVVDEYWKLALTKQFNNIKEPESIITVGYEVE